MRNVRDGITLLEVKSMEPKVLEQLSELLISVVEDGASIGFLPPQGTDDAIEYWQEVIQPGVIVWIAIKNDKIIGTVQLHLAMKQNASHRAKVAKLMVHRSYRRNGIAQLLMQTIENTARTEGRSLLVLDTRSGDPSNNLYISLGYIEAGRIPNYAKSSSGSLDGTIFYYKEI
jgi:ribosomal protein S18 acetylase RimI-like enzyme